MSRRAKYLTFFAVVMLLGWGICGVTNSMDQSPPGSATVGLVFLGVGFLGLWLTFIFTESGK